MVLSRFDPYAKSKMKISKTRRHQQNRNKPAKAHEANVPLSDVEWRELCVYIRKELDANKGGPSISETEFFKGFPPIKD